MSERISSPAFDASGLLADRIAALTPQQRALLAARARRAAGAAATGDSINGPVLMSRPRQAREPLSVAQEGLWFYEQLDPGAAVYALQESAEIDGPLDVTRLEASLRHVIARHETLRTAFTTEDGTGWQVVAPAAGCEIPLVDLSALDEASGERATRALAARDRNTAFDLGQPPLLRVRAIRFRATRHAVLFTIHHLVADGWSIGLLLDEVVDAYAAFARGDRPRLAPLPVQYADYVAWQRACLEQDTSASGMTYWKTQLHGASWLAVPPDRPRDAALEHRGRALRWQVPRDLELRLQQIARTRGATLFMVLLASFDAWLARFTGQTDIVVGTPVANRSRPELERVIGLFLNTLVLRVDAGGNPTFAELVDRVRDTALGAYAHQDVPFEKIVQALRPERDASGHSLFQVFFNLQNTPASARKGQFVPGEIDTDDRPARFDLNVSIEATAAGLLAEIEYRTALWHEETITRMLRQWQRLLVQVAACPNLRIGDVDLLDEDERRLVLREWNDTARAYDAGVCVQDLIRYDDSLVAVECGARQWTYGELHRYADRIASWLRSYGVGPERIVGVCVARDLEMIGVLLGVLKAGGAYLPLDASYPPERLAYMVTDAGASVIVTQTRWRHLFAETAARVICLDADPPMAEASAVPDPGAIDPAMLAYVIYTSGSTGRPKGVMISHAGVVNLTRAFSEHVQFGPGDTVLALTVIAFDLSVLEIFWTLSRGARVLLTGGEEIGDPSSLAALVTAHDVSIVLCTPATAEMLAFDPDHLRALHGLRAWLIGGEAFAPALAGRVCDAVSGDVINMYGPTEMTVCSSMHHLEREAARFQTIPIGRPLANTTMYVVGRDLRPAPIGVFGDLFIGGDGVARGYRGRPALTAERFIPDPFGGHAGRRMYRTGDVARWLPSGVLEFAGRKDHQVKLRGHRIELQEIEAALAAHPAVRQAIAAVIDDDAEDRRLGAWIVPVAPDGVAVAELEQHVRSRLPSFMIPSSWTIVPNLPLTPNGKIDRNALRALPVERRKAVVREGPRTPTERLISEIWSQLLRVPAVARDDNFFEIGGHSLLAMRLLARVRRACHCAVPLLRFLNNPTVAGLADAVDTEPRSLSDERHATSLTLVREGDAEPPLACVHPLGGGIWCYVTLAQHLSAARAVYGFSSADVMQLARLEACESLEQLAAGYNDMLRAVRSGPAVLAGWSFGGLVALEMGIQRALQGEPVPLVVLFDTRPPQAEVYDDDDATLLFGLARELAAQSATRLDLTYTQLVSIESTQRCSFVAERLLAAGLLAAVDEVQIRQVIQGVRRRLDCVRQYRPRPYAGRVLLFRSAVVDPEILAAERVGGNGGDPALVEYTTAADYGWSRVGLRAVDVEYVDVQHNMLLLEPYVRDLAARLDQRIDELSSGG